MNLFLDRIEPFILSDDVILRDFALHSIKSAKLGSEGTFHKILKAMDKLEPNLMVNKVLPYASHITITESMLQELIARLKKEDDNRVWYSILIFNCDFHLLQKYQDDVEHFLKKDFIENVNNICTMDSDELFSEIDQIIDSLKKGPYFDQSIYNFGKKIYRELIRRGDIDQAYIQEIGATLKEESKEKFISYGALFKIYLAGELDAMSLIPELAGLLSRHEEDALMQEVTHTLIKLGSPNVFPFIDKYIQNENTFYEPIDILKNVKDPIAEEILLQHFDLATDITAKTLIAEALCYQLSVKAIPIVAAFIESGYDTRTLDLREPLYANCMINGIDHTKLAEWKAEISQSSTYQDIQQIKSITPTKKVGRNEPCPCGSGKKYKKCCGK